MRGRDNSFPDIIFFGNCQRWDGWIIWKIYFHISEESSYCLLLAAIVYIPTNSGWLGYSPQHTHTHRCQHLLFSDFCVVVILTSLWFLLEWLVNLSIFFFMYLLAIWIPSFEKCLFIYFAFFLCIVCFVVEFLELFGDCWP